MKKGTVEIYSGEARDTSALAVGRALKEAQTGNRVMMVFFFKRESMMELWKRLEPELKVFQFESVINGLNFARKVLSTGECELLILDGIPGIAEETEDSREKLKEILAARSEEQSIILTGRDVGEGIYSLADRVFRIETVKYSI